MWAMSSEHFYAQLPVLADFAATADFSNYTELPQDWQIVIADVEDSTDAIASGQYKAVNIIGVSIITSVLNIARPLDIPLVFGGDGASLCIPAKLADDVASALVNVQEMAQLEFALKLRIAIFPLTVITTAGYKVLVARHRLSEHYVQAAFAGGGMDYAESLLKNEIDGASYRLHANAQIMQADFSGLECRWDNVPSKHGETISLIVKALGSSPAEDSRIYSEVINRIETIYGNEEQCNPVSSDKLRLSLDSRQLGFETRLHTFTLSKLKGIVYFFKIRFEVILGFLFMRYGISTGETNWGEYKSAIVRNTDFKKFDGSLRQVLSGTATQRQQLTDYLEQGYRNRECVFGIHVSSSALITCLVYNRTNAHYHFVDGADGGYATAAVQMKKQLHNLAEQNQAVL